MPRKVFTAGEVLAASDVNSFLMDQTVMVFAGTAARGSAIGTAVEGMYAHLNDTDTLTYYDGSAWVNRIGASAGILQVESVTKTDIFTTSSSTYQDITGLTVTITPSSATNKLLIIWGINFSQTSSAGATHFVLTDGSNNVLVQGDTSGSRTRTTEGTRVVPISVSNAMETMSNAANSFLYSPSTTSAVTIKFRAKMASAGTLVVNRNGVFNDDSANGVPVSSLTVMEVVA